MLIAAVTIKTDSGYLPLENVEASKGLPLRAPFRATSDRAFVRALSDVHAVGKDGRR
jgi:hypothetical protein